MSLGLNCSCQGIANNYQAVQQSLQRVVVRSVATGAEVTVLSDALSIAGQGTWFALLLAPLLQFALQQLATCPCGLPQLASLLPLLLACTCALQQLAHFSL
jgi:hypothetical protein